MSPWVACATLCYRLLALYIAFTADFLDQARGWRPSDPAVRVPVQATPFHLTFHRAHSCGQRRNRCALPGHLAAAMSNHTSTCHAQVAGPTRHSTYSTLSDPVDIYTYLSSPPQSGVQMAWESQNHIPRGMSTLPLIPESFSVNEAHIQTTMPSLTAGPDGSTLPSLPAGVAAGHAAQSPWSTASQNLLTPQYPFFPTITTPHPSSLVNATLHPSHQWRINNRQHDVNGTLPIAPPPHIAPLSQQTLSDMLGVQHLVTPHRDTLMSDRGGTSFEHLSHFRTPVDHPSETNSIDLFATDLPSSLPTARDDTTMDPKVTWWPDQLTPISDRVSAYHAVPQILPQTPGARPTAATKPSSTKRGRRTSTASSTTLLRKKRPAQLHLPPPTTNMRLPIPPPLHSAPAAPISLDLLTSSASRPGDTSVANQQPPKVDGWIKPEDRPLPPVGYVQPTPFSVTPLDRKAAPSTADPSAFEPPSSTRPRTVPRTWSAPQLRPHDQPAQAEYMVVPGLNGVHVVPWQPYRPTHIQPATSPAPVSFAAAFASMPMSMQPSVAAGPGMNTVSTGSNSGESTVQVERASRTKPVHRRASGSQGPGQKVRRASTDEEPKDGAVCDICDVKLSRQSDLHVSAV